MSTPNLARLYLTVAAWGPLVVSCQSAPTRVFTLESVPSTAVVSSYVGPPIRVDAVHVPPPLDRIEILSDVGRGEMQVNDREHWAAPLGELARQALTADLISRLPEGKVIFPHLSRVAGSRGVAVDILVFSADRDGARLDASWVLTSASREQERNGGSVQLHTTGSASGAAATAQALSALLAQLADRISLDLSSNLP